MTTTLPEQHEVRVRDLADVGDLWTCPPSPHGVVSWIHGGRGMIGWGEAARFELTGPNHYERADQVWSEYASLLAGDAAHAVAFVSFSFDGQGSSVLVVPRTLVTRDSGGTRVITIGSAPVARPAPITHPERVRWSDGELPGHRWRAAVTEAVRRIERGELDKVVLARDLLAESGRPIDQRFLLRELTRRHPQCWAFAVDGLVGATPEMLLRRDGAQLTSRVLAGSTWTGAAADQLSSETHLREHDFAVRSLVDAIAPHCREVRASGPAVLPLRNIAHLSTDVSARLTPGTGLFDLARAVHPTAAVGGTPRNSAMALIHELEALERGRYAAPVGWVDAGGDGELGIALRCAQVTGSRARLFAGCGLVAGSDPDSELRETEAKFAAVREVLGN